MPEAAGRGGAGTGTAGTTETMANAGSGGQPQTMTGLAGAAAAGSGGMGMLPQAGRGMGAAGSAGEPSTGGAGMGGAGMGGNAGQAGQAGMAGAAGMMGEPEAGSGAMETTCASWPTAMGQQQVGSTIRVSRTFDGELKRYAGVGALGSGSQDEGQDPLFELADGATLENVIVGAPAADGIHCQGSCTLRNVWWEDVGEDAATLKGNSRDQVMSIECGGARKASDKVFQHNGPGTIRITDFIVEDFGKLYRSCGNCRTQHERHVEMSNIEAKGGKVLAGVNANYGDSARFENIMVHDTAMKMDICDRYTGNDTGSEPRKTGSGADGKNCIYEDSDISWVP